MTLIHPPKEPELPLRRIESPTPPRLRRNQPKYDPQYHRATVRKILCTSHNCSASETQLGSKGRGRLTVWQQLMVGCWFGHGFPVFPANGDARDPLHLATNQVSPSAQFFRSLPPPILYPPRLGAARTERMQRLESANMVCKPSHVSYSQQINGIVQIFCNGTPIAYHITEYY